MKGGGVSLRRCGPGERILVQQQRKTGVHNRSLQNPCESIPFSDLQCSRARRLRENCVLAKPRYATFRKIALKNALFFTAKLCHGKGVMQACAAGARYATLLFDHVLLLLSLHWVLRAPSVKWWVTTCSKFAAMQTAPTFTLHFSFGSQVLTIFYTQNLKMSCIN